MNLKYLTNIILKTPFTKETFSDFLLLLEDNNLTITNLLSENDEFKNQTFLKKVISSLCSFSTSENIDNYKAILSEIFEFENQKYKEILLKDIYKTKKGTLLLSNDNINKDFLLNLIENLKVDEIQKTLNKKSDFKKDIVSLIYEKKQTYPLKFILEIEKIITSFDCKVLDLIVNFKDIEKSLKNITSPNFFTYIKKYKKETPPLVWDQKIKEIIQIMSYCKTRDEFSKYKFIDNIILLEEMNNPKEYIIENNISKLIENIEYSLDNDSFMLNYKRIYLDKKNVSNSNRIKENFCLFFKTLDIELINDENKSNHKRIFELINIIELLPNLIEEDKLIKYIDLIFPQLFNFEDNKSKSFLYDLTDFYGKHNTYSKNTVPFTNKILIQTLINKKFNSKYDDSSEFQSAAFLAKCGFTIENSINNDFLYNLMIQNPILEANIFQIFKSGLKKNATDEEIDILRKHYQMYKSTKSTINNKKIKI